MTDITHLLTCFIEQLCWEWSCAHTGAVCLDDTKNIANLVRSDTQTNTCACTNGVGRRDKRIRAKVNVEHRALSTFAKHRLSLLQKLVDFMFRIHQLELLDVLNAFHPLLLHLGDIVVGVVEALEDALMTCLVSGIFLFEVVEDVTDAQTITAGLVSISGTNTLARCSHLVLAFRSLVGGVEQTVSWHDEVCLL